MPERRPAVTPEQIAQLFHEAYERLAPDFGYRTREESAKPWADVPDQNKALMVATVGEILPVILAEIGEMLGDHTKAIAAMDDLINHEGFHGGWFGAAMDAKRRRHKEKLAERDAEIVTLRADLEQARAEARTLLGERNWLLADLDDEGRHRFHLLAQTAERARADGAQPLTTEEYLATKLAAAGNQIIGLRAEVEYHHGLACNLACNHEATP
jgi:hypothetical protein